MTRERERERERQTQATTEQGFPRMQQHRQHILPCALAEVATRQKGSFFPLPLEERLRLPGTDVAPEIPPRKHLSLINVRFGVKGGISRTIKRQTAETCAVFRRPLIGATTLREGEEGRLAVTAATVSCVAPWTSVVKVRGCRHLLAGLGLRTVLQKPLSEQRKKAREKIKSHFLPDN